jgi:hypothetical protein
VELSVKATGMESESNSSIGPNGDSFLSGDASFHSLTVTGALGGGETLTFSGSAAADMVLYKSSTVTITLDEQTLLLPPGVTDGSISPSITTGSTFSSTTRSSAIRRSPATSKSARASASYGLTPPAHS